MSVIEQLRDATTALEQAIDGSPPPLKRQRQRQRATLGPSLLVGSLVAGGGLLLLQGGDDGTSRSSPVEIAASGTEGPTDRSSAATTEPETEEVAEAEEVADAEELVSQPPLHVLADNPPGWALQQAVALPPPTEYVDVAGAVDLLIRPTSWLPIGQATSLEVSVQQALYRNPAEAEVLTVRGHEATLLDDGHWLTLTWAEDTDVHVVVTSSGYDRQEVLAVAEGLGIDHVDLTASAEWIPDGSTAISGAELPSPAVSLVYRHQDGSEATVYAVQTDRVPTEADRSVLRTQADGGYATFIERPEGIGMSFLAHDVESVINWWTEDGLFLVLQSKTGVVSDEALADLAASIVPVNEATWSLAGGQ